LVNENDEEISLVGVEDKFVKERSAIVVGAAKLHAPLSSCNRT
jgi:hypothetical protein